MNDSFRINFDWLNREHGDALERATFAQIEIAAAGRVLTSLEDLTARTVRPYVRASAYPFALWLTANWWRLRWEPRAASLDWAMSHDMASVGGGYVWPSLLLSSDGETVLAESLRTEGSRLEPVRYLGGVGARVQAGAFEQGVDAFVEGVLERLASVLDEPTPLHTLWQELRAERADLEATAWRRLEAKLGCDPDEAPELLVKDLHALAGTSGIAATEEIAAASKTAAPDDLRALWAARPRATRMHVPDADAVRNLALEAASPAAPPWKHAVAAAQAARRVWGVAPGPLPSHTLASLLDLRVPLIEGSDAVHEVPMPAAFRTAGSDDGLDILLVRRHPATRRFALARLIGDYLCGGEQDRLLPATDAKTARQKFQRAFAQELLCPFEDLVTFLDTPDPSEEDIEDAAHYFEVSPLLARMTLVNNGYFDRSLN